MPRYHSELKHSEPMEERLGRKKVPKPCRVDQTFGLDPILHRFFFVCCCREFCCREFGNRTIYPPNSEFNLQLVFGSRITRIPDRAGYDGISPPLVGDRYFVGLGIEPRAIRMPYGVLRTTYDNDDPERKSWGFIYGRQDAPPADDERHVFAMPKKMSSSEILAWD